jgi:hypothetical protein
MNKFSNVILLSLFTVVFSTQIHVLNNKNQMEEQEEEVTEENYIPTVDQSYKTYFLNQSKFIIAVTIFLLCLYIIPFTFSCIPSFLLSLTGIVFLIFGIYVSYLKGQPILGTQMNSAFPRNILFIGTILYLCSFLSLNLAKVKTNHKGSSNLQSLQERI